MTKHQIKLWQQMADLTLARCKKTCKSLGSCCSETYCEQAADLLIKAGKEVPPFRPFINEQGNCVVPPQFRPLCTVHQCDICNLGFAPDDPDWTEQYFKLRNKLKLDGDFD